MSTLVENVAKVKSAHDALSASIEAKGVSVPAGTKLTGMPALVDQIQSGSGFTEDTTTLSVAFGGVAKKITPKDVISFSSLTWQGQRHELGSKDYSVFDGNFQLDEAFWPAKPLPGYIYFRSQLLDSGYVVLKDANNNEIIKDVQTYVIKIPEDGFLLNGLVESGENYFFEITNSQSPGATIYEGSFQTTFDTNLYYFITAKSRIQTSSSNKLIVVADATSSSAGVVLNINGTVHNIEANNGVVVQTFNLNDNDYFFVESYGWYIRYFGQFGTFGMKEILNGEYVQVSEYKQYGDIVLTNNNSNIS